MGKYYKINNEIVILEVRSAGKFLLCRSVIICQHAGILLRSFVGKLFVIN
jgi:hypothetical protein